MRKRLVCPDPVCRPRWSGGRDQTSPAAKTRTEEAKSSARQSAVNQIQWRTFGPVFRSRKQPVPYLRHIALLVHETHKGQQSEDRKSPTCSWPGRPESTSVPRERPTGPRDTVWTERVNLSAFGAPSVRGGNVKEQLTPEMGIPDRAPDFCQNQKKRPLKSVPLLIGPYQANSNKPPDKSYPERIKPTKEIPHYLTPRSQKIQRFGEEGHQNVFTPTSFYRQKMKAEQDISLRSKDI